jgi:4-amino-4-deoxychorismate lyase
MTENTWINGEPARLLDVADRGLHYGDGLFETIAVFDGQPQLLQSHLERLARGMARLKFPDPDLEGFEREIRRAAATAEQGVLKLILTRGSAARGYRPPEDPRPTRILSMGAWPDYPASNLTQGVRVRVCRQRLSIQPVLAGLKHLNRLEQVLARAEWSDPEVTEGLMLDMEDRVVCASMSNLYLVSGRNILTPALERCGVSGVMRAQIRQACARFGLGWEELDLGLEDVRRADELMLSNALAGLWPVRELDGRVYSDYPICRELQGYLGSMGVRQCAVS